jgi:hypothetical protein
VSSPVRIPADVDMHDRVLGPLTARQLAILAVTGLVLYAAWTATRAFLPIPVFFVVAIPIGAAAAVLALGQRDGVSLDRLLIAAIRQRLRPRHQVAAPEGVRPVPEWLTVRTAAAATGRPGGTNKAARGRVKTNPPLSTTAPPSALRLPAEAVTDTGPGLGVVDLGTDGLAVVAVASTVNFALRTPAEQEALVAGFGRYLHSLTAGVQVLVRTQRLDLSGQIAELRARAGGLPHPALEAAALEHADYLVQLGEQTDLLRRQVLLILREPIAGAAAPTGGLGGPGPLAVLSSLARSTHRTTSTASVASAGARRAAESRLVRRLTEAVELLAPAGIVVTGLDAGQATAVLASACNPDTFLPPSAGLAGADEVITSSGGQQSDLYTEGWPGHTPGLPHHGWDEPGLDDAGDVEDWDYDEADHVDSDYPDTDLGERGRWS